MAKIIGLPQMEQIGKKSDLPIQNKRQKSKVWQTDGQTAHRASEWGGWRTVLFLTIFCSSFSFFEHNDYISVICSFNFSSPLLQNPFWYCRELILAMIWGRWKRLKFGQLEKNQKSCGSRPARAAAWPRTGGSCSCHSTGAPPSPATLASRLCMSCGKQGKPVLWFQRLICCTITWCSSW